MKILDAGKHWIKLNETDYRLRKLQQLLPDVERWVADRDPRVVKAMYWGVTKDAPEETVVVNLTSNQEYLSEELLVTYEDVMREFPYLKELFKELELQPFLGTNKIGNWGIHRHCYNPTSRWNLVMIGEGNKGARGEFFNYEDDRPLAPDWDYGYDILDECEEEGARKLETVYLKEGDWYSIDTWQWHSHRCEGKKKWHPARAWLMHFKYAPNRDGIHEVFDNLNSWGVKRLLWRWAQETRYRHGTHSL